MTPRVPERPRQTTPIVLSPGSTSIIERLDTGKSTRASPSSSRGWMRVVGEQHPGIAISLGVIAAEIRAVDPVTGERFRDVVDLMLPRYPQPEVPVLGDSERPESSHLLERFPADDHGAQSDAATSEKVGVGAVMAAISGSPVDTLPVDDVEVSGAKAQRGTSGEDGNLSGKFVLEPEIISVQEGDERGAGLRDSAVARGTRAGIVLADHTNFRVGYF